MGYNQQLVVEPLKICKSLVIIQMWLKMEKSTGNDLLFFFYLELLG